MTKVAVARLDQVRQGEPLPVDAQGTALALFNLDGTLYALADSCTHEYSPLSQGEILDGAVECFMHGAQFDIRTGKVLALPAVQPVKTYDVT